MKSAPHQLISLDQEIKNFKSYCKDCGLIDLRLVTLKLPQGVW